MPDATKKAVIMLWQYDTHWEWECLLGTATVQSQLTYRTNRGAKQAAYYWCDKHGYAPSMGGVHPGSGRIHV